jgi:hypothetical protein
VPISSGECAVVTTAGGVAGRTVTAVDVGGAVVGAVAGAEDSGGVGEVLSYGRVVVGFSDDDSGLVGTAVVNRVVVVSGDVVAGCTCSRTAAGAVGQPEPEQATTPPNSAGSAQAGANATSPTRCSTRWRLHRHTSATFPGGR